MPEPVNVVFSGGMGAQILAASAYFELERIGKYPTVDLSYFLKQPRTVKPGETQGHLVSIWPWELGAFGLEESSFRKQRGTTSHETLADGNPRKVEIALRGLMDSRIRSRFAIAPDIVERGLRRFRLWSRSQNRKLEFSAVHIRRGDYQNVATWMVGYDSIADAIERHVPKSGKLILLSDSPVPRVLQARFRSIFSSVDAIYPKKATTFETHILMRESSVLVGSNSQFSLTASLLGPTHRFLPKRFLKEINNPLADNLFQGF